jgi:hypothetical protein
MTIIKSISHIQAKAGGVLLNFCHWGYTLNTKVHQTTTISKARKHVYPKPPTNLAPPSQVISHPPFGPPFVRGTFAGPPAASAPGERILLFRLRLPHPPRRAGNGCGKYTSMDGLRVLRCDPTPPTLTDPGVSSAMEPGVPVTVLGVPNDPGGFFLYCKEESN